jgi:F0F1-type ATP synthase membrane subunit b/b'
MDLEEDKDVLQHLLHLEAEASALVDDAQAEADRRVSEGEKQNRAKTANIGEVGLRLIRGNFPTGYRIKGCL